MTRSNQELNDILQTLDSLQSRVHELTADQEKEPAAGTATAVADPVESGPRPGVIALAEDTASLDLLITCVHELTGFTKLKDFPQFFGRLAEKTGLRLVLLKRWTSGLQVFMERNIKLPAAAKRKGRDGKAPIPCSKGDIFQAVGDEATIYSGPVPVKHFPLDLTLMLGRGSSDREILILPLPSQNHWNTFLYLDADKAREGALAIAEVLAHFALARMWMLNKGIRSHTGRVNAIGQAEVFRREKEAQQRRPLGPVPDPEVPDTAEESQGLEFVNPPKVKPVEQVGVPELNPFEAGVGASLPAEPVAKIPLNPGHQEVHGFSEEKGVSGNEELPNGPLTPELILNHSGELPALPKAACHIMAVIEDPKTTATRLEKALAMDQALTAKVLRIANSPFYGAVREIRTVSEAVVRLGFVTIRNWTVVTATKSVFLAPGAGQLYQKIWRQSVMSAMAGQLVGQAVGTREPESLFIGGLMQNIGQLVLARSHPQLFQEILTESESTGRPYHEVERGLLGFDHGELGALLIRDWNLSRELEQAVRWHHNFQDPEAQQSRQAAMIALGEEIAACSSGQSDDIPEPDPGELEDIQEQPLSPACQFLGISNAQYLDLQTKASQLQIDPHFFS